MMSKLVNYLIYILILSIPLGQLGRLPLGSGGVTLYIQDLLVLATLLVWLIYSLGIKKSLKIPQLGFLIGAFALVAFISLVNGSRWISGREFLVAGMYWLRWVMYAGIFLVVYNQSRYFPDLQGKIVNLLILSGVTLALTGFIQLALVPDFGHLAATAGWDPHKNRLLATFFDPNFTGCYLVLSLNLVLAQALNRGNPFKRVTPIYAFYAAVLLVALILTFSRSAWLMMGVSVLVFGVLGRVGEIRDSPRKRTIPNFLLMFAIALFLLAYFAIPRVQTRIAGGVDPDDSAKLRFESWTRTSEIIGNHPWLGVGFNAYRYAQQRYGFFDWDIWEGGHAGAGADSSLLFVWATTGVGGVIFFLLIYLQIGKRAFDKRTTPLGLAILASLVGLLIESNFINSLFYSPIMLWWWMVAATPTQLPKNR